MRLKFTLMSKFFEKIRNQVIHVLFALNIQYNVVKAEPKDHFRIYKNGNKPHKACWMEKSVMPEMTVV